MKVIVLAIHDSKAEAYLEPFYAINKKVGQRMFGHACNNPEQNFSQFPADYTLFKLGEFDGDTGEFDLLPAPENLGNGLTFMNFAEENPPDKLKMVGAKNVQS